MAPLIDSVIVSDAASIQHCRVALSSPCTALWGASGSGKTSMLRAISLAFTSPYEGGLYHAGRLLRQGAERLCAGLSLRIGTEQTSVLTTAREGDPELDLPLALDTTWTLQHGQEQLEGLRKGLWSGVVMLNMGSNAGRIAELWGGLDEARRVRAIECAALGLDHPISAIAPSPDTRLLSVTDPLKGAALRWDQLPMTERAWISLVITRMSPDVWLVLFDDITSALDLSGLTRAADLLFGGNLPPQQWIVAGRDVVLLDVLDQHEGGLECARVIQRSAASNSTKVRPVDRESVNRFCKKGEAKGTRFRASQMHWHHLETWITAE